MLPLDASSLASEFITAILPLRTPSSYLFLSFLAPALSSLLFHLETTLHPWFQVTARVTLHNHCHFIALYQFLLLHVPYKDVDCIRSLSPWKYIVL